MKWRLWLARFFCPHGHLIVDAKPAGGSRIELTLTCDASDFQAKIADAIAALDRLKAATPAIFTAPPAS